MATSQILITPEFRMSYPNLAKARPYTENGQVKGDPVFSVEMLFDADKLSEFKRLDDSTGEFVDADFQKVCVDLVKKEWGDIDIQANFKVLSVDNKGNWPVKSGDVLSEKRKSKEKIAEAFAGKKVISAKAKEDIPPKLGYRENGEKKVIVRHSEHGDSRAAQLFAGGNYAIAELTLKPVEVSGTKYIAVYVNYVRHTRDGERLGGQSLMDRFDGVTGGDTDYNPTEGMEDDIPF